jgi:hypothetical protein
VWLTNTTGAQHCNERVTVLSKSSQHTGACEIGQYRPQISRPWCLLPKFTEYVLQQAACRRSTPGNIIPVAKLPGGVFGSCAGWSAAAWRPPSSASVEGRFGVAVHHVLSCVPLLSSCKLYSSHGFLALTTFLTRCYLPLQSVFLIPCN